MSHPLPVIDMPSAEDFVETYIANNRPVVVAGLDYDEAAWSRAAFAERLGDLTALVYGSLFDLEDIQTLDDYLDDWFGHPSEPGEEVPYIRWYNQLRAVEFAWGDDAFARLIGTWAAPSCLPADDLVVPIVESPDPTRDAFPYRGVLVAAQGARTRLHRDPFCTDAVVCQFLGAKHAALYHPSRAAELAAQSDGTSYGGFVDVRGDDGALAMEPDFQGVVKPGEMIYIPHGWLHDVLVTDDSLSVTWNFIHQRGAAKYVEYLRAGPSDDPEFEILQFFHDRGGVPGVTADVLLARMTTSAQ